MLREAVKKRNFSEDAAVLAKAASLVRTDIFNQTSARFTGCFPQKCQEDSLPSSLKFLISLILNGPSLTDQNRCETQACLTVGQAIVYNTKKRAPSSNDVRTRHSRNREPPLPIYIGLNIHQATRSRKLIQQFFQLGISISYDRVLEIEDDIASGVIAQFEEGVVAPICLRKGLFTVGALDNIDHNPSSTTAMNAFHGTGISLFQFPTRATLGETRSLVTTSFSRSKQHFLPDSYAVVPAVALKASAVEVPAAHMSHAASAQPLSTGLEKDPLTLLSPITTKSASVPLTPVFEQSFSPVLLSSTTNAPANKTSAKSLSTTCLEVSMLAPSTSPALSHFEEDPPALSSPAIFAQSLSTDATYLSPVSLTTGPN